MRVTFAPLMTLLLIGCSGEKPTGPCGESFCLPFEARLLSKKTPLEDFNLYQVAWRGARFDIYEGNHPQGQDDVGGSVVGLPGNRAGMLRVRDGQASIIFDTQNDWPAYLDVM